MGMAEIGERILADARREAEEELSRAGAAADEARASARQEAERVRAEVMRAAEAEARSERQRILAAGEMEPKRALLAAKGELIAETLARVRARLGSATSGAQYKRLLLSWIERGAADLPGPEVEVILAERDVRAKVLGEKDLASLAPRLPGRRLVLSRETRPILGGVVLRSGAVELNASFDARLEARQDELAAEIARRMFS